MTLFLDPLDRLLDEVMSKERQRRFKKLPGQPKPGQKAVDLRESFSNPESWIKGSVIALIHRSKDPETLTLLGSFQETTHKRIAIRRLTRLETPMEIEKEEYVSGSRWLNPIPPWQGERIDDPDPRSSRWLTIDLSLEEIGLMANSVDVIVDLENGWIRRVCLGTTTQFQCPSGRSYVSLPKGIDVLPVMSFENKISLKKALESLSAPS